MENFTATVEEEESRPKPGCSNLKVIILQTKIPNDGETNVKNQHHQTNKYTRNWVQAGLYSLSNAMQYTGDRVGLMAGVVIIMVPTIKVPTILLYTILSERIISGITMGSVKA